MNYGSYTRAGRTLGLRYKNLVHIVTKIRLPLTRRIFLPRRFNSRKNSNAQKYYRTHRNPMRWYVHQVGGINQANDHDGVANRINCK